MTSYEAVAPSGMSAATVRSSASTSSLGANGIGSGIAAAMIGTLTGNVPSSFSASTWTVASHDINAGCPSGVSIAASSSSIEGNAPR